MSHGNQTDRRQALQHSPPSKEAQRRRMRETLDSRTLLDYQTASCHSILPLDYDGGQPVPLVFLHLEMRTVQRGECSGAHSQHGCWWGESSSSEPTRTHVALLPGTMIVFEWLSIPVVQKRQHCDRPWRQSSQWRRVLALPRAVCRRAPPTAAFVQNTRMMPPSMALKGLAIERSVVYTQPPWVKTRLRVQKDR